jgi:predicted AAA+ superfamily ATPase
MAYLPRITDVELERKLSSSGAVLIRGPKACGKTESATQFARSILQMDQDPQVPVLMSVAPKRLLLGETPRLIDEWQVQPEIWNYVRHEVDNRKQEAQFILTGSATPEKKDNPEEEAKMHSGAGRFTKLDMRTMSWQELGFSTGAISLESLFNGAKIEIADTPTDIERIVERIIIGGFPALVGKKLRAAMDVNRGYVDLLAEADISRVPEIKRDPIKVRALLRSLARNTATLAEITTFEADTKISRPTIYDYLSALERLMIVEDQPAWDAHLRSSASLRKTPKRHFTDVCLAVAALGATRESLLADMKYTGFLFESLAIHELRVYGQAVDAKVYHYHDSTNLEVDAIVQKYNGDWSAFEIKLGIGQIDEAAANLLKLASVVDAGKSSAPKSLNIITGTGISYTRSDGVNVISLASLGV